MTGFAALPQLETDRLILRAWRETDLAPYAALNADSDVMKFFPARLDEAASRKSVESFQDRFIRNGLAPHAVEEKASGRFIGFVGLSRVEFDGPVAGEVEIGWRLSRASWGQGFAREAAMEALRWGFEDKALTEIIAFAPKINTPSLAVMRSIGMTYDTGADFIHTAMPADHPLQPLEIWRKTAP